MHGDRYASTDGDVGPQAAVEAAQADALRTTRRSGGVIYCRGNGRGVYQVVRRALPGGRGTEAGGANAQLAWSAYLTVYVDPGPGAVNGVADEEAGFTWWLYRGHMQLWQDHGIFGVFDPESGWCRPTPTGRSPAASRAWSATSSPTAGHGRLAGRRLDRRAPRGLLPLVLAGRAAVGHCARRPPRARRFAFNLSLHKVVGLVVFVPLLVVAFTGRRSRSPT